MRACAVDAGGSVFVVMDFTINKFDPTLSTVLCSFTLLDVVPISFLTVGSSGAVFFATFDGYVRAVDMSGMLALLFIYFELSSMSRYVYRIRFTGMTIFLWRGC